MMGDPEKYRPWRFERPADNQDNWCDDPMPGMAAGSPYKRPGSSASAIARAGYEVIERGAKTPRNPFSDY
jgi:hypothetical protein